MSRFCYLLVVSLLLTACGRAPGPVLTVADELPPTAVPAEAPVTVTPVVPGSLNVRIQFTRLGTAVSPELQLSTLSKYAEIRVSWLFQGKQAGERVLTPEAFLQPFELGTFAAGEYSLTARCFDASGVERAVLTASFAPPQDGANSPTIVSMALPGANSSSGGSGGSRRVAPPPAKASGSIDVRNGRILQPSPDALTWGSSEEQGATN